MKEAEEKDGRREVKQGKKINVRAIQVRGKNEIEQTKALSLRDQKYPKLRKGTGFTIGGAGANAGRQAGANAGLGRQVSGRQTRRIAGA